MVTLKQMEELLDTKLSKLENRIVKNLTNPTDIINPNTDKTKQVSNIVIDETNLVTPVRHSLPEKTFYDECTDLQIKQVHDLHYNIEITFFYLETIN